MTNQSPKQSHTLYDQQGQIVQGNQNNVAGDQHVHHHYPPSRPRTGQRCDFYSHIHLPPNFVPRTELFAEIKQAILAGNDQVNGNTVTPPAISKSKDDAFHGMGGIGKTVLARALCDDEEVREAFPDGILWTTLGQTPEQDLDMRLREWIGALGGIIPEIAPSRESLKNNLANLLNERRCLLIVDDVWYPDHARWFQFDAPHCRLLMTTRDAEIARRLGATVRPVPAMTESDAIALLCLWGGEKIGDADPDLLKTIVNRLGRLPLALKLAGSQLSRRSNIQDWIERFDAKQLQEKRVYEIHDSLAATFALSLDELGDEERHLYAALVIFKEDEATPQIAIENLWLGLKQIGTDQSADLLYDLADRALLNLSNDDDGNRIVVTLHDLLRDFLKAELTSEDIANARQQIIAWGRTYQQSGWPQVTPDYLFLNFAEYLILADRLTELYDLVEDDHWHKAKSIATPWPDSLTNDLNLATHFSMEANIDDWIHAAGFQIRRALVDQDLANLSPRSVLFLARIGEYDRAQSAARRHKDYRNDYLLREIACIASADNPQYALTTLMELARSADEDGNGESCVRRQESAQVILTQLPTTFHSDAKILMQEAEERLDLIPTAEQAGYVAYWVLPNHALLYGLETITAQLQDLPPLEQAKTSRRIAHTLPNGDSNKRSLLDEALSQLDSTDDSSDILSEKLCILADLMLLVDVKEYLDLRHQAEQLGNQLTIKEGRDPHRRAKTYMLKKIASIDPTWVKQMMQEENWSEDVSIISKLAKAEHQQALVFANEHYSIYANYSQVLVDIIGVVAQSDPLQAETLIEEYHQKLSFRLVDAYVALAEGYLSQDKHKAREIFNQYVLTQKDHGSIHAKNELHLGLMRVLGQIIPSHMLLERISQVGSCPNCRRDDLETAERIVATFAIAENNISILDGLSRNVQKQSVEVIARRWGIAAAQDFTEQHNISLNWDEKHRFDAVKASIEAIEESSKLDSLLEHFNGEHGPHHFCAHMRILPSTLWQLVETSKIETEQAKTIIVQVILQISEYQCRNKPQRIAPAFIDQACHCIWDKQDLIAQLMGILYYLDTDYAWKIWNDLSDEPFKAYSLVHAMDLVGPGKEFLGKLIEVYATTVNNPQEQARIFYQLATKQDLEASSTIERLIQLGDSIDVGKLHHTTTICRARAQLRLIRDSQQLLAKHEAFTTIKTFTQLGDKVAVIQSLIDNAMSWSPLKQRELLLRIMLIAREFGVAEVNAFLIASMPLIYKLDGQTAVLKLIERFEWANKL